MLSNGSKMKMSILLWFLYNMLEELQIYMLKEKILDPKVYKMWMNEWLFLVKLQEYWQKGKFIPMIYESISDIKSILTYIL